MPRIRYIKPDFFTDEDIAELSFEARLLFIGLWCYADRNGRLEERPKYLKIMILPYDNVNIDKLLNSLAEGNKPFIIRYKDNIKLYIQLINFNKHQKPHHTEKDSIIPEYTKGIGMEKGMEKGMGSVHEASTKIDNRLLTVKSVKEFGYTNDFLEFYKAYPRHEAKKKGQEAWSKNKPNLKICLESLKWQKEQSDWKKDNGKWIPLPASWINGERWQDESPKTSDNGVVDWDKCDTEVKKVMKFYVSRYLHNLYKGYTIKAYNAFLTGNKEHIDSILAQCNNKADMACRVILTAGSYYFRKKWDWTLKAVATNCSDYVNDIKRREKQNA